MGFLSGVVAGLAVAAGAAAWYMSRSGEKVREQYQFEKRLGEIGDQMEARTRDIQSQVNQQIAEMRAKGDENGRGSVEGALDDASASAAEAAAEVEAKAEDVADDATRKLDEATS